MKRSRAWTTVLGIIGATVAVVLVSIAGVGVIAVTQLQSNIKTVKIASDTEAPPPSISQYEGGFNILLVGTDTGSGQGGIGAGVGRDQGVGLNDVTMIMHVAQDQQSAVVVSIPRDMLIPFPACSNGGPATAQPMNVALSYGGLPCVALTIQNLTGLKIQFAGMITFRGVINMSDAVGGVPVCFAGPINDKFTGLYIRSAGTHTLTGASALAFLRSRHGVGDGSDIGRISSQQVYLSALVRKIKSDDTLTNFTKLYGIASAATKNITLSQNFTHLDTLVSVALVLKNIPLNRVIFVQYPGTTGVVPNKVVPVPFLANQLFSYLKADKPFALDANSLTGNHQGSVPGKAPKPTATPTPTPTPTPTKTSKPGKTKTPTATPTPTVTTPPAAIPVLSGIKGQTAAQYSCSQPYQY